MTDKPKGGEPGRKLVRREEESDPKLAVHERPDIEEKRTTLFPDDEDTDRDIRIATIEDSDDEHAGTGEKRAPVVALEVGTASKKDILDMIEAGDAQGALPHIHALLKKMQPERWPFVIEQIKKSGTAGAAFVEVFADELLPSAASEEDIEHLGVHIPTVRRVTPVEMLEMIRRGKGDEALPHVIENIRGVDSEHHGNAARTILNECGSRGLRFVLEHTPIFSGWNQADRIKTLVPILSKGDRLDLFIEFAHNIIDPRPNLIGKFFLDTGIYYFGVESVAAHVTEIPGIELWHHKELAETLVTQEPIVARLLKSERKDAAELVKNIEAEKPARAAALMVQLPKFTGIHSEKDQLEMAELGIVSGAVDAYVANISAFDACPKDKLAKWLAYNGEGARLVEELKQVHEGKAEEGDEAGPFDDIPAEEYPALYLALIRQGYTSDLLASFRELPHTDEASEHKGYAVAMIKKGEAERVIADIASGDQMLIGITKDDHVDLGVAMIARQQAEVLFDHFDELPGIAESPLGQGVRKIIKALIESRQAALFLSKYEFLQGRIDDERGRLTEKDHKPLIDLMLHERQASVVLEDLMKAGNTAEGAPESVLTGITVDQHLKTILASIEEGQVEDAIAYMNRLEGVSPEDHIHVAEALIHRGDAKRAMLEILGPPPTEEIATPGKEKVYELSGKQAALYRYGLFRKKFRREGTDALDQKHKAALVERPEGALSGVSESEYFHLAETLVAEGHVDVWIDYNRMLLEGYTEAPNGDHPDMVPAHACQVRLMRKAIQYGRDDEFHRNPAAEKIIARQAELGGDADMEYDHKNSRFVIKQLGLKDRPEWHSAIAEEMVTRQAGAAEVFAQSTDVLHGLSTDEYKNLALKMVTHGFEKEFVDMIESLPSLQNRALQMRVARELVNQSPKFLMANVKRLTQLTDDDKFAIASVVLRQRSGIELVRQHHQFPDVSIADQMLRKLGVVPKNSAEKLFEFAVDKKSRNVVIASEVAAHFDFFADHIEESMHTECAARLASMGARAAASVVEHFSQYAIPEKRHEYILKKLIAAGASVSVLQNFDVFTGVKTLKQIDQMLRQVNCTNETIDAFFQNLEKFNRPEFQADHRKIIDNILKRKDRPAAIKKKLIQNFEQLTGVEPDQHLSIINWIIYSKDESTIEYAFQNIRKFPGVSKDDFPVIQYSLFSAGFASDSDLTRRVLLTLNHTVPRAASKRAE